MAPAMEAWTGSQSVCPHKPYADLLESEVFQTWYGDECYRELLLLGTLGSGKTTAMHYLVDALRTRMRHCEVSARLCYAFCKPERANTCVQVQEELLRHLTSTAREQEVGLPDPETVEDTLKAQLQDPSCTLFVVIDGLNEMNNVERAALLLLLRGEAETRSHVKVLLSSRPQWQVAKACHGATKLQLTWSSAQEVGIVQHLVNARLTQLSDVDRRHVADDLVARMHGCILWVVAAIEYLEQLCITAWCSSKQILADLWLPPAMVGVWKNETRKAGSNLVENRQLMQVALEVVVSARRALSMRELAVSVTLANARNHSTVSMSLLEDQTDVGRVAQLISPFIHVANFNDLDHHQVTLSHPSLREFVLKSQHIQDSRNIGCSHALHDPQVDPRERLEIQMLDICMAYLDLEEIGRTVLFNDYQLEAQELVQDTSIFSEDEEVEAYTVRETWDDYERSMLRYDPVKRGLGPLFVYTSCYWIHHLRQVRSLSDQQLHSLERICHRRSTRLYNWTQQSRRPTCTLQPRFNFDSELYDPLSIVCLYASEEVLAQLLRDTNFKRAAYQKNTAERALEQLLLYGKLERIPILFHDPNLGRKLWSAKSFRAFIRHWAGGRKQDVGWNSLFELAREYTGDAVRTRGTQSVLKEASRYRCTPLMRHLQATRTP